MNLFRSAAVISTFTFLSRITGLVRDITITFFFGVSPLTDSFWIAFRIPNFLRRLFAEGAFSQAFIPIIGKLRSTTPKSNVRNILNQIFLSLLFLMSTVILLGMIIAPYIVRIMGSGIGSLISDKERIQQIDLIIRLTQIMFPYIFFISLSAFFSGVLNVWKNFSIPAFTPILLNLSIIISCFSFPTFFKQPIYSLAIGVLIGGALQFIVPYYSLKKIGLLPNFSSVDFFNFYKNSVVKEIYKKMIPAMIGISISQISLIINTNIASWLQPGSVTWITLSDRLMEFSVSLIGVTLGTILITNLLEAHTKHDQHAYSNLIDWAVRLVILLGFPVSIGMAAFSEALVSILFHYGKFTVNDVINTKAAITSYSIGIIGLLLVKVLIPAFYVKQNIKTPLKISIIVLAATQITNFFLVPRFGHCGIILGVALGACLNAFLLFFQLYKNGIYMLSKTNFSCFIMKVFIASAILYCFFYFSDKHVDWILLQSNHFKRILTFSLFLILGALIYFSILLFTGIRPKDFYLPKNKNC